MEETKEYDVPDEITALFNEVNAMSELRDIYIKRPFGFKKAKKCSIAKEKASAKAWHMFNELRPETYKMRLQYITKTKKIKVLADI